MSDSLIPITDEQAKAIQEALKLGGTSLDLAKAFGGYVASVLGTTPHDIVGLLGGDWIKVKRAENLAKAVHEAKERLRARGVLEPQPISLSLALPLLHAAGDEDRQELVDLWARLLAAAMDPARTNRVRQRFIEIVQRLDPLDALVLQRLRDAAAMQPTPRDFLASHLQVSADEVEVSFENLLRLEVIGATGLEPGIRPGVLTRVHLTSIGRQLLMAVSD